MQMTFKIGSISSRWRLFLAQLVGGLLLLSLPFFAFFLTPSQKDAVDSWIVYVTNESDRVVTVTNNPERIVLVTNDAARVVTVTNNVERVVTETKFVESVYTDVVERLVEVKVPVVSVVTVEVERTLGLDSPGSPDDPFGIATAPDLPPEEDPVFEALGVTATNVVELVHTSDVERIIYVTNDVERIVDVTNDIEHIVHVTNDVECIVHVTNDIERIVYVTNSIEQIVYRTNDVERIVYRTNDIGRVVYVTNDVERVVYITNDVERIVYVTNDVDRVVHVTNDVERIVYVTETRLVERVHTNVVERLVEVAVPVVSVVTVEVERASCVVKTDAPDDPFEAAVAATSPPEEDPAFEALDIADSKPIDPELIQLVTNVVSGDAKEVPAESSGMVEPYPVVPVTPKPPVVAAVTTNEGPDIAVPITIEPDEPKLEDLVEVTAQKEPAQVAPAQVAPAQAELRVAVQKTAQVAPQPQPDRKRVYCPLYVIRRGDLISRLAKQYGFRVSDFKAVNPGVDVNRIRVGQRVKLPGFYDADACEAIAP